MARSKIDVAAEVKALNDLPREQLVAGWVAIYGCPPPPAVSGKLLLNANAWHLQAKRLGGLKPETRRLLKRAVAEVRAKMIENAVAPRASTGVSNSQSDSWRNDQRGAFIEKPEMPLTASTRQAAAPVERRTISPGARLIRDWNGRTHIVDVIEHGFIFEEASYRSLSAIARKITGAQWSGPR